MGRKFGFSFSWKRASGLSAAKGRLAHTFGLPLTREGRRRKFGPLGLGLRMAAGGRGNAQYAPRVGGFSILGQRAPRSGHVHVYRPKFRTALIRALIRLFGVVCITLAVLLGLFALFGYLMSDDTIGRVVAGVLGAVTLLLLIFGVRAFRHVGRQDSLVSPSATKPTERSHTGLHYDDFKWGYPPPSRKQFGYAMHLGAEVRHGMTKWMLSDAIDAAIEQQRSGEPPTKEQLEKIKEYHGVLPRAVTRGEANRVIEFLENYYLPCPFCKVEIAATDDVCCACNKSLRKMKIPIKL